jgi:hypothetical protein
MVIGIYWNPILSLWTGRQFVQPLLLHPLHPISPLVSSFQTALSNGFSSGDLKVFHDLAPAIHKYKGVTFCVTYLSTPPSLKTPLFGAMASASQIPASRPIIFPWSKPSIFPANPAWETTSHNELDNHHVQWINQLFRLGHFSCRFLYVYQAGYHVGISQGISIIVPSPYGASCRRTNVSPADPGRSAHSGPGNVLSRRFLWLGDFFSQTTKWIKMVFFNHISYRHKLGLQQINDGFQRDFKIF